MRVLFIFPFCAKEINSIAYGPIYLGSIGHDILVLTAQNAKSLKGTVKAVKSEIIGGTEFYRPYKLSKDIVENKKEYWKDVVIKINDFNPDVVVGFGVSNHKLIFKIKNHFHLPLVYFLEYLNKQKPFPPIKGRKYLRRYLTPIYNFISKRFLNRIVNNSNAIMYSYFGDIAYSKKIKPYGENLYYVPWCNEIGNFKLEQQKVKETGIYIGSLEKFKNAKELLTAIPLILNNTKTKKFTIVGPGYYAEEIKKLALEYENRLIYYESIPREKALQLIAESGYGFTPVKDSGLGFIGDCWATKTPLITTHDLNGFLKNNIDTIISPSYIELPQIINSLLESKTNYLRMQTEGYERYKNNYSAKAVGENYLKIFNNL